ncbi:hypothetical protein R1flu_009128 [Riccia fluitans]|uniref:Uncharacterized protein n=1 Tax=Riccia fluitans TaxID=41844 RepID=A0ABD1Z172_9MARC
MASTGAAAALSCGSKGIVSLASKNGVDFAGKCRVSGSSLDVLFRKNCDLSRGLGAALHLVSNSGTGDVCDRSLPWAPYPGVKGSSANCLRKLTPRATVKEGVEQESESVPVQKSDLKEFLDELKTFGRVRLIVNTGVAVLESVTTFEKLFYSEMPGRGEWANVMRKEDNVDFHLLLDKVKSAKLTRGKSMRGDIPTYMVRFLDINDKSAVSVLVMWKPGTDGEYDPGQVEAFEALEAKYGTELKFLG